jgi:hypothetical protein
MMTTQHTPGPWHTAGDQGVQIRSEKHQIAKVWTMRGNEWKANARLIAAAPDLLEALRELVSQVQGYQDCNGDKGFAVTDAIAAIAKATGETK